MSKVDGSLVSLIQGVSQQPPRERLPGQCTLQENMSSDPVDGLGRRQPTVFVGDLFASDPSVTRWEEFVAPDGNRYIIGYGANRIRVWTLAAVEKALTFNHPTTYLTGEQVSLETVDNRTFVVDRSRITKMLDDLPLYSMGGGLIWLLGGQYGRTYRITVKYKDAGNVDQTVSVTYNSPNGGTAADSLAVATEALATQLFTALTGNATFNLSFGATRISDVIYIRWLDTNRIDDFDLTVDDGDGGANIFAMTRRIDTAAKLPRYAPHRYIARITGDGNSDADDWYLQFLVADDLPSTTLGLGFGKEGVWRECTGPFEPYKWDTTTMPHALVQDETTGQFTWAQAAWMERRSGDDDSNPPPSLLGRTINDLSTFQGRLSFASGPNVVMSRINKALDLWIQSATTQADDDPIDVQSTAKSFSVMRYFVPQNRDLIVFSDKAQFIILGRTALKPDNAALVLSTSFEADLRAAPVPTGRNVFFAFVSGLYTGIKEFYAEGVDDVNDSRPITQHVSQYIPGTVRQLASTSNFDNLIVLSSDDQRKMYIYEYLWVDDAKAQSSWSTLIMPHPVVFCTFDQNVLYIVMNDNGRHYLNKMELSPVNDTGLTYIVHLDNKVTIPGVTTTINLPYSSTGRQLVAVQGAGCPEPGMALEVVWSGNTGTMTRSMGGGSVIVGERYLSRYKPTMPMVKDRNNVKLGTGRLTLKRFLVQLKDTGFVKAIISSRFRDVHSKLFSGRIIGDPDNQVGRPAIASTAFGVRVGLDADACELELQSDSHMPWSVSDIEWVGQWTKRGKRIANGSS